MTNLIEKVAELRKLEEKATPGKWYYWMVDDTDFTAIATIPEPSASNTASAHEVVGSSEWLRAEPDDMRAIVALRNAAPRLLDALGKIQAGDAKRFDLLLNGYGGWTGSLLTEEDKNMLCRYRDLARLMEDDHE